MIPNISGHNIKAPSTRIRKFSNPQLFRSGYGYRPHVSGEFDSESGKNKYALQSGKKYIRHESDNVWTGESGYFLIRWRKKRVQSLTEQ